MPTRETALVVVALFGCLLFINSLRNTGRSSCEQLHWTDWSSWSTCSNSMCTSARYRSCTCSFLRQQPDAECEAFFGTPGIEARPCTSSCGTPSGGVSSELPKPPQDQKPRYMLSIPGFGPNNQYMGMKEAILIAKLLGRTFVRPDFWLHSQFGLGSLRTYDATFEPEELNKHIPSISLTEFTRVCNGSVDVLFWMRKNSSDWMNLDFRVYSEYLTQLAHKTPQNPFRFNKIVFVKKDYPHEELGFRSNEDVITYFSGENGIYKDIQCIGIALPFRNIWYARPERELLGKYVIHSKNVQQQAEEAIASITSDPSSLLSFHWRFGEDSCAVFDWENYDFCFGTSLFRWTNTSFVVDTLHSVIVKYRVCTVFMAIADHFEDKDMYKKFIEQLQSALDKENTCPFGHVNLTRSNKIPLLAKLHKDNYMLSLVEQSICTKSKVFVASTDSTWSDFVVDFMNMNLPKDSVGVLSLDKLLAEKKYPMKLLNLFQEQKVRKGKPMKAWKRSVGFSYFVDK